MAKPSHPPVRYCLAALLALLAVPAFAAPPPGQQAALAKAGADAASALHLTGMALDNRDLTGIRGGFDPSPGVTLNFAFQQTTYQNHQVIQSTMIPDTTLTVSPSGRAGVLPQALQAVPSGTVRAIALPANRNPAMVLSETGPGGITNVIRNTGNDQLIQQVTAINIGISGLNQLLSRQTQALTLAHAMVAGR
jgi:hypothetical protein